MEEMKQCEEEDGGKMVTHFRHGWICEACFVCVFFEQRKVTEMVGLWGKDSFADMNKMIKKSVHSECMNWHKIYPKRIGI